MDKLTIGDRVMDVTDGKFGTIIGTGTGKFTIEWDAGFTTRAPRPRLKKTSTPKPT